MPGVTLRGVFNRSRGDLLWECDLVGRTFRGRKATDRGCPLTFYASSAGKAPSVDVFCKEGAAPGQITSVRGQFDWYKDIHVHAANGAVQLGDEVEVTGTLDTMYGDCTMDPVTAVKLLDDAYGPGHK